MVKARKSLTTIVGACLAAVAAGSLVLFSILAQNATLGGPVDDSGVQVATPDGSAPVISLPGSSNAGDDDGAQSGAPDGSDEPLTGPLALLLEPLTPGELVAELGSPDGDSTVSPSTPPSAAPTAPGPDDDAVAIVPERLGRGPRLTLDTNARAVRAAIRALRAQDGGRPSPGDGGNEAPGKSGGAGHGKDKGDKPGRGHGAGGKSNKGGKGHGRTKDRAAKPAKEKKSKAPKAKSKAPKPDHSNGGGHQKTSSTAPTRAKPQKGQAPSHSTGPPAQSKSKAPKPAPSKAKSPPGHAAGGPPGQSKEKKKKS
jgi:hypothetical protein